VHVVVVVGEHSQHARRAGQAGVRTDEQLDRAGSGEAVLAPEVAAVLAAEVADEERTSA
jgi:hypothetical protein